MVSPWRVHSGTRAVLISGQFFIAACQLSIGFPFVVTPGTPEARNPQFFQVQLMWVSSNHFANAPWPPVWRSAFVCAHLACITSPVQRKRAFTSCLNQARSAFLSSFEIPAFSRLVFSLNFRWTCTQHCSHLPFGEKQTIRIVA